MTDKERLEEIKEDVFKCNHGSTRGYSYEQLYHIALSLVRIHGEWLIKQAERVQELEEENRKLNFEIGSYAMQLSEISQMVDREMNEMKKLSSRMLKGESK